MLWNSFFENFENLHECMSAWDYMWCMCVDRFSLKRRTLTLFIYFYTHNVASLFIIFRFVVNVALANKMK